MQSLQGLSSQYDEVAEFLFQFHLLYNSPAAQTRRLNAGLRRQSTTNAPRMHGFVEKVDNGIRQ
jgi:hypothetical protein